MIKKVMVFFLFLISVFRFWIKVFVWCDGYFFLEKKFVGNENLFFVVFGLY